LTDITRHPQLLKSTARRVLGHIFSAAQAGADLIMVTCSSLGPVAEIARHFVDAPVLRVDQAMVQLAIQKGDSIGVVATLPSTLNPTAALITAEAQKEGRKLELISKLCAGAFDAFISGDGGTHDRLVAAAIAELSQKVDVIVLAQASMARVVDNLPNESKTLPILSSPRLAVEHLATLV
jgi:Asp/Glu/hydantoin racemase